LSSDENEISLFWRKTIFVEEFQGFGHCGVNFVQKSHFAADRQLNQPQESVCCENLQEVCALLFIYVLNYGGVK